MSGHPTADRRLEGLRRELARIQEELGDLPEDAFVDRLWLRERQADLRAEARRLASASASAESEADLRDRLRRLRLELERRSSGRVSHAAAAQTGRGGGIDPAMAHELNRRIDEGTGIEGLRREIRELERRLSVLREPDA